MKLEQKPRKTLLPLHRLAGAFSTSTDGFAGCFEIETTNGTSLSVYCRDEAEAVYAVDALRKELDDLEKFARRQFKNFREKREEIASGVKGDDSLRTLIM